MFTGIVERTSDLRVEGKGPGLWVSCQTGWPDLAEGESICVDGVCLTATEIAKTRAVFFLSPETVERTRFGKSGFSPRVNLERALRADARLGGHFVTGHVDGIGTVLSFEAGVLRVELSESLARQCPPKGSICLTGVSLTINRCQTSAPGQWWIEMQVIPHTQSVTTLADLKAGDPVNLETDLLVKTLEHLYAHFKST